MCRVAALQAGLAGQGWRQVEEDTRLHGLVRCQAILSMASEPRPSQGAGGAGGGGPEVPRHAPPPHPGGRGGGPGGPGWWLLALQKPFICLKFSRLTNTRAKGNSSPCVMKPPPGGGGGGVAEAAGGAGVGGGEAPGGVGGPPRRLPQVQGAATWQRTSSKSLWFNVRCIIVPRAFANTLGEARLLSMSGLTQDGY